jgi:hypothetical protein
MSDERGAARFAEIDRMAAKLKRLPAQRRALNAAIRAFGDDFDHVEWSAAFMSEEVLDINRVWRATASNCGEGRAQLFDSDAN